MKMKQKRTSSEVPFNDQELEVVSWALKRAGLKVAELSFDKSLREAAADPEGFWIQLEIATEDTWTDDGLLDKALSSIHELRDIDLMFKEYLATRGQQGAVMSRGGFEVVKHQHKVMLCTRVLPVISGEVAADEGELDDHEFATAVEVQGTLLAMQDDLFSSVVDAEQVQKPRSLSGRIAFAAAIKWKRWIATSFPADEVHEFSENTSFGRMMNGITSDPRRAARVRWALVGGSVLLMVGLGSMVALL